MDPHPNFQTFWSPLVVFRDIISHDMGLEAANGCGFFFHQPWGIQHFETKLVGILLMQLAMCIGYNDW